jgi:hypothetical protein
VDLLRTVEECCFGTDLRLRMGMKGPNSSQNKKPDRTTLLGNLKLSQWRLQDVTRIRYLSPWTVHLESLRLRPQLEIKAAGETTNEIS